MQCFAIIDGAVCPYCGYAHKVRLDMEAASFSSNCKNCGKKFGVDLSAIINVNTYKIEEK